MAVPAAEALSDSALIDGLIAARREVSQLLGDESLPDVLVYVVRSERDFKTLTRNRIPHWGIGVAYPHAMTIVLRRRAGQAGSLLQTARHEFSHLLLHQAVGSFNNRIPVWFNEGVSTWAAREWRVRQSFDVAVAALREGLIPLGDIDSVLSFGSARANLAYDQSYLAVLLIVSRGGEGALQDLISQLRDGMSFDTALFQITGMSSAEFESTYEAFVARRFGLQALVTSEEALWLYIVVLVGAVWIGVQLRNRRTVAQWEEEDPLEGLPLRLRTKINREREL